MDILDIIAISTDKIKDTFESGKITAQCHNALSVKLGCERALTGP